MKESRNPTVYSLCLAHEHKSEIFDWISWKQSAGQVNAFHEQERFPSRTISILNAFDRYKRDLSHDPKEEKRETENPLEGRDVTACSQVRETTSKVTAASERDNQ